MRSVRNHNDPTDVAGNFGAVVHSRDMAYQHDDQNVQADRPRAGRKYLTERGATRSPPRPWLRFSAVRAYWSVTARDR